MCPIVLSMDSPCLTSRQMKESSSRGHIKEILGILVKTYVKMLKKYGFWMARSGPVVMRSIKWAHDVPRDSCSFCFKDRTSFRRLTTLEMGKKAKQNLEHSIFQSHCILPMVCLYHRLALPIKENGNNVYHKVLLDMPMICKHAQVYSNSCRCEYGFWTSSPEKDCSWINFIKHRHSS